MTARLLVIGLDAVEAPVLESMIDEGELPALARLVSRAGRAVVHPRCLDTLPGAIWTDLSTGVSAEHHGDFYPERLHTGESLIRSTDLAELNSLKLWSKTAEAGLETLVVDQPLVPADGHRSAHLTLVSEWHVHDQIHGPGTHPRGLLGELDSQHERQPVDRCDAADLSTVEGIRRFRDLLEHMAAVKADMAIDLLGRKHWDLAWICFSEGHCAGHQLWHLHDPNSAWHDVDAPQDLHDSVRRVYRALDTAVGRLVEAADAESVVVVTSHGMGPYIGGPQLLPPVLRQLGKGDHRRLPAWIRPFIPMRAIQQMFRRSRTLRTRSRAWTVRARGFVRPDTRAIGVANNRIGAIRLSRSGREPDGLLSAEEADSELADIEAELWALRDVDSEEPVVSEVIRTADAFPDDRHPDLPDLLVRFRRDLGELVSVYGPRVGRIDAPFRRGDYVRTGDHTESSRIWVTHRSRTEATDLGEIDTIDLAPTLLTALGVDPGAVDGVCRSALLRALTGSPPA